MAKLKGKEKVEDADIVQEEATSEQALVSVEMTEDQKTAFVQFMKDKEAKEKETAEAKELAERHVHVRLSTRHYINGEKYGPGVTKVPYSRLGQLQHQENMWKEHELNIMAPSRLHLQKILEGGTVVEVATSSAPKTVREVFQQ